VAVVLAGCGGRDRPHAPALSDEPVYQNDREGFRFLVPDGWTQIARGELPPGRVERERMLVEYRLFGADKPATLEVTALDLDTGTDLKAYLAKRTSGETWRPKGPAEALQIDGTPATRLVLTGRPAGDETTHDVLACRRGDRVYFFTGVFSSSDSKARDQVRRAVQGIVWKK
jgi:hypothetical protein